MLIKTIERLESAVKHYHAIVNQLQKAYSEEDRSLDPPTYIAGTMTLTQLIGEMINDAMQSEEWIAVKVHLLKELKGL